MRTTSPTLTDKGLFQVSGLAFWSILLFTIGLWIELLVRGPIPLFAAMERYDYSQQYGGPLHLRLIEWGPMLAFQLGVFFVAPALHGRLFDRRFRISTSRLAPLFVPGGAPVLFILHLRFILSYSDRCCPACRATLWPQAVSHARPAPTWNCRSCAAGVEHRGSRLFLYFCSRLRGGYARFQANAASPGSAGRDVVDDLRAGLPA